MSNHPYEITIRDKYKRVKGDDYNYIFNMENGHFARWGKTEEDNPSFSPIGPELLDIEVSTICHGDCPWCYKSNTPEGKNMDFNTFQSILDIIPETLTQVAFGVGDLDTNPDLWKMFDYSRKNRVIPNITINGRTLDESLAQKLVKKCGAVAVSHYDNADCFNAVELLGRVGLQQVNIHKLVAQETLESCFDLIDASKDDPRLKNLNAIVLLALKPKGERNNLHPLALDKFSELIKYALRKNVPFGFDSCSATKVLKVLRGNPKYPHYKMMAEPCESTCFSLYINCEGKSYPCSFLEGEPGYEGIDMLEVDDFMEDVWYHPKIEDFRANLLKKGRNCPHFQI